MIHPSASPRAALFAAVTTLYLFSASTVLAQGTGNQTNASPNTGILAGSNNLATNSTNAFIGAGAGNSLQDVRLSAIVAGTNNSVVSNSAFSFIGAGQNNSVQFGFNTAVVAGINNTNSGARSVIVGGRGNILGRFSASSTIAGGEFNTIRTVNTQVFGNLLAGTIGGGISNLVDSNGFGATIGGGLENEVWAPGATVPGGSNNVAAGTNSFAAGSQAVASNTGTFVWADMSTNADFVSTAANQFLIRARGGVGINTNSLNGRALFVSGDIESSGQIIGTINSSNATFSTLTLAGPIISSNSDIQLRPGGTVGYTVTAQSNDSLYGILARNIIAGYASNSVSPGVGGATIAGGGGLHGANNSPNTVSGSFGTVGGGIGNQAGILAVVGGGFSNAAYNQVSTVVGGANNTALANYSAIGGGYQNTASGIASTISGGGQNTASGENATIGGGFDNTNAGLYATIAGGRENTNSADTGAIGGGQFNNIPATGTNAVIAGGGANTALGSGSTVSGGLDNVAGAHSSTVAGGYTNVVRQNIVFANYNSYSAIGGGSRNAIGGGTGDSAYAVIGGGLANTILDQSLRSVIAGGWANSVTNSFNSTIGGGQQNSVANGSQNTIVGGLTNFINNSTNATVAGGIANSVTNADSSAIGGGRGNKIGDSHSAAIPGGQFNEVRSNAHHSFAAGYGAKAYHAHSFVWGGTMAVTTTSIGTNSFTVRAPGGVRFYSSGDGYTDYGVWLVKNASAWSSLSDSNAKTGIRPIDPRAVLAKVDALPVTEWEYKHDPDRRYFGPMAQDFHAAFGLGSDDKTINTLDADGVLFLSVKGLVEEIKLRDKAIAELKAWSMEQGARSRAEVDELKAELRALREEVRSNLPPAE